MTASSTDTPTDRPRPTPSQQRALDPALSTVVGAGAGSGKTTVLVDRYLRLVLEAHPLHGRALDPRRVLAITYTKKAAAGMRARILAAVRERVPGAAEARALAEAVRAAPISTLHAFCRRALDREALRAGLTPGFGLLDPIEARLTRRAAFTETIDRFSSEADGPDALAIERLASCFTHDGLVDALEALSNRGGLSERWAARTYAAMEDELRDRWDPAPDTRAAEVAAELLARFARVFSLTEETCSDPGDKLATKVREVERELRAVSALSAEEEEWDARAGLGRAATPLLTKAREPRRLGRVGAKGKWSKQADVLAEVRDALGALATELARVISTLPGRWDREAIPLLRALATLYRAALARYRAAKAARSEVDFGDLTDRTLALLADPGFRDRLRGQFDAVLVDELQDMDPELWRLVEALVTGDDGALIPGRLFAVGDQKQSIYRFRGADVTVMRRLEERLAKEESARPDRARRVVLEDNFRTAPGALGAINALFDHVLAPPAGGVRAPFEAEAAPLIARRRTPGPGAVELALAVDPGDSAADEDPFSAALWECDLVARWIHTQVAADAQPAAQVVGEDGTARRPRYGDIAILLRQRTHLKLFEGALRARGIPFAVHGGIGFYDAPEITDVHNLLSFLVDPAADAALAGVLRSPLGGLSDDALLWVAHAEPQRERSGGRASLWARLVARSAERAPTPDPTSPERKEVRRAASLLRHLCALAGRVPAAELVTQALERSGAAAVYAALDRGQQGAENLDKLRARLDDLERDGASLVTLAARLERLVEASAKEPEAQLPQEKADVVRILTVHASKGLEFPVVVVPGLGSRPGRGRDAVRIDALTESAPGAPTEVEVALQVPVGPGGGAKAKPALWHRMADEARCKEEAESRRLFYVAATRARDHLLLVGAAETDRAGFAPTHGQPCWLAWTLAALCVTPASIAARSLPFRAVAAADPALRVPPLGEADRRERPGDENAASPPPTVGLVLPEDLADPAETASPSPAPVRAVDAWLTANPASSDVPETRPDPAAPSVRGTRPAPGPPVLSPSRWKLLRGCPLRYRFAATLGIPEWPDGETTLGLWAAQTTKPAPGGDGGPPPPKKGAGRVRGTVVHRLLERGVSIGASLAHEVDAALREQDVPPDPAFREWVVREAERALDRVANSDLGKALGRATHAARERSFVLPLGPGTVEGTIDALFQGADGTWCVVDWKTDALRPEVDLEAAVRHRGYDAQLDLYALAAASLLGLGPEADEGPEPRVRAALFFTARGEAWEQTYDRARLADVARRAIADLAILAAGTPLIPPTPPCKTCGFFGGEEDIGGVLAIRRVRRGGGEGGEGPGGGAALPWGRFGRGAGICNGPERTPAPDPR